MLTGTTAENQAVDVETITTPTKNCNVYHVTHIQIEKPDPNDATNLTVYLRWVRGYDEAGVFVQEGAENEIFLNYTQASPHMGATVDSGDTHETAFKKMIWAALQAEASVVAGTVS